MNACHSCDYYSARDRWCSALEDRVVHPEGGRCSAHSQGADACCTCDTDEEDQCDACAFGAGEEAT